MEPEEKTLLEATVLLLMTETEVALAEKKGKIGAGFLNGPGGGLEPGEDERMCMVREAHEEWNIMVGLHHLTKVAVIDFHNQKRDGTRFTCRVHFFSATNWLGEPQESGEMGLPQWFLKSNPPLERMMLADRTWFPLVMQGHRVVGEAWYGPKQETLERDTEVHIATEEELLRLRF